jgi:serine/threonine-protein kinase
MDVDSLDLTGAVLDGRYRVIEPIAEGAMGIVYRAERVKLGKIVAIKVLHDELPNELSSRKRFEIEAMAMAKLEHPHVAGVLDVGIHNDRPFFVMDFVSGVDLKEVVAAGPIPILRAVEIVRQVLSGLAHAHEHGIIHRDIKPANVVLSQKAGLGDHVKILDFGLARLDANASNLTTGIVVGTPSYMAPEQIRGTAIDKRADLYACGVLMFELLTGKKPFISLKDDPIEVCSMHLKMKPPRLADIQPGLDFGRLEGIVARALAKPAGERYQSAEEFAAALDVAVPRHRTATPVAGVPLVVAATPSGWAMPSDGVSTTPGVGPPPLAHLANSVPVAASGVLRSPPSAPVAMSNAPGSAPVATSSAPVATSSGPGSSPGSAPVAMVSPGSAPALAPGFDLSTAIPQPPLTTPIAETSTEAPPPGIVESRDTVAFLGAPPAGPSPLATRDASPGPEVATTAATRPGAVPAHRRRLTRQQLAIGGGALVVVIIIIAAIAGSRGGSPSTKGVVADAAVAVITSSDSNHADEQVARVTELMASKRSESALELALSAHRVFPKDPRLPYLAGTLYFNKFYYTAGLQQFRDTFALDPTYRSDPELIKTVLRHFIADPSYNRELANFLRDDIGEPAKPFIEETAKDHPKANVRARAAAELRRYP